jgi:DNA-binding response OmpR family regulator
MKILVADDEGKIVELVAKYLEAAGYSTLRARDGLEALSLFRSLPPTSAIACAILDISMPGINGLDLAREMRRSSDIPIIFLTARADETDRIVGLELGADDYMVKPFSPRELVARVRALLRRSSAEGTRRGGDRADLLVVGDLALDSARRELRVSGKLCRLTAAQFQILALLMRSPGKVFSRLELMEASSGSSFEGYERTVDAHVKNLRKALGDDGSSPLYIGTVRGVGYKLLEPDHAP